MNPNLSPADAQNDPPVNSKIDNLFRREAGKVTAVLTRVFGVNNLELVEDVVQDTLLKALQQWPLGGVPENPEAWIYKAAKNKAVDILRREKLKDKYASDLNYLYKSEWTLSKTISEVFSDNEIKDDQLRMIFTCCHPSIPVESQVALALKTLCGFGIKEIAKAFLLNEETIAKRITRAKTVLRKENIRFQIPAGDELKERLNIVLSTLYLLFNEGYNSMNEETLIREDLIAEAIRLTLLLCGHKLTETPAVHALLSLMLFHTARIPARTDSLGNIYLLEEQDRSLWNRSIINEAIRHMGKSAEGKEVSEYHLEAGIAYFYTTAESFEKTEWEKILRVYDIMYKTNNSPVVGLNRAIVYAQVHGPAAGIKEIKKLEDKAMDKYYLYHSALGEMHSREGNYKQAEEHFKKAIELTTSNAEKKLINKKLDAIK